MRRQLGIIGLGMLLLAGALLVQAPAWLLSTALVGQSGGKLALEATEGTIWSGRGRLELVTPKGRVVLIDRLGWSLAPLPLLGGRAVVDLHLAGAAAGHIEMERAALAVRALELDVPAAALAAMPPLEAAQPTGTLHLSIPELYWASQASQGGGLVTWRDASLRIAQEGARWRGEIQAQISAKNDTLRLGTVGRVPAAFGLELRRAPEGMTMRLSGADR